MVLYLWCRPSILAFDFFLTSWEAIGRKPCTVSPQWPLFNLVSMPEELLVVPQFVYVSFNGIDGPFIHSDQNTVYNTSFFCCYLRIKICTVPLLPVSSAGPSAVVVGGKATLRTHSRDLVSWKKRNNVAPSRRLGHFASIHLSKSFVMRRYEIFTVCVVVGTCKNTIFRYF